MAPAPASFQFQPDFEDSAGAVSFVAVPPVTPVGSGGFSDREVSPAGLGLKKFPPFTIPPAALAPTEAAMSATVMPRLTSSADHLPFSDVGLFIPLFFREVRVVYIGLHFGFKRIGHLQANFQGHFLECVQTDPKGKETIFSWVTDLKITQGNVFV